ncbi:MAG: 1-acyl-sn-glycerol-3-phosphate acyltransferase [Bacteroidetes bacterium]|nr:1-acyl-sn-glycerol-3-phosphate acyltransferase [Bacteroidota bacterium]
MKKTVDFLLSALCMGSFFILLVIFQPIQWIAYQTFGEKAQRKVVEVLNFFLVGTLFFIFSRISFNFIEYPPTDKRIIFVANHQSMHDIPSLIWFLRKYKPVFVSKLSLGKGIPSISYNLQKSGAALIDRKDGKQAIKEIIRMAEQVVEKKQSVLIFPEGTRSRTEDLLPFMAGGISALIKKIPDSWIVPIAISGNATMNPKGLFPLKSFQKLNWTVLSGFSASQLNATEICEKVEGQIKNFRLSFIDK